MPRPDPPPLLDPEPDPVGADEVVEVVTPAGPAKLIVLEKYGEANTIAP